MTETTRPTGDDYRRLSASRMRPAVKAVLGVLMRDGQAARDAGLLWIADRAGISRRSVETALSDLEALGLVVRRRRRWQTVQVWLDLSRAVQWLRDLWNGSRAMYRQAVAAAVAAKAARLASLLRPRSATAAQSSVAQEEKGLEWGPVDPWRVGDTGSDGRKIVGQRLHGAVMVPIWA
jgi:hypothetical protein